MCILLFHFISAPRPAAEWRLQEARDQAEPRRRGFPLVRSSRQAMVSPVSMLDGFARRSPMTPRSPVDE
ncbi:hypothetical protein RHGRI_030191 [Rhododendron griersonianum]|uniref:Uncharacterized protein n=1 Tax=Rhododendron griersonianum TaxID=479676 RepID=A0AAV6IRL6_9ERIC|nr:hypothetical protein RHGRI_030191 [Rhododendron griersonianum]